MAALRDIAKSAGLKVAAGPPGELRAGASAAKFSDACGTLAEQARLADLFANRDQDGLAHLAAIFDAPGDSAWLIVGTDLSGDEFASITPRAHLASWYEREIREVHGIEPVDHPAPMLLRVHDPEHDRLPKVRGQGVFQLPLGPVRSGPQESAEFLFNSGGEDLVMVSPLLGYKLRDIERMAQGRDPIAALQLAERLAGTSTFSNALAFVQAMERAGGVEVGPGVAAARSLLNELERLHCHFGDVGRLADACGLVVAAAQYLLLKEEILRHCAALTGHRYLRGFLEPGGSTSDLTGHGLRGLQAALPGLKRRARTLNGLLEATQTFIDRVETTGFLTREFADPHALVGPIGRSTGADRDCRRDHPYAAYDRLRFEVLVKSQGDALARVRVRLFEIEQSLGLVEQLLDLDLETGPAADLQLAAGSALGWAEAPGGEALHFVSLRADGALASWRARPPAVVNWHPYAQACASGNNLTDYPVIEASFALSHAEFDR